MVVEVRAWLRLGNGHRSMTEMQRADLIATLAGQKGPIEIPFHVAKDCLSPVPSGPGSCLCGRTFGVSIVTLKVRC
jgi:hypothetical protein